jgi:hypothetical protein
MNLMRPLLQFIKPDQVRNNRVVCLTTFRQGRADDPVERTRADVFLDTARKMKKFGLPLITSFIETDRRLCESLERLGVMLVEQRAAGMGNIRREILSTACSLVPNAAYYCWLEPEKPDIVRYIPLMIERMLQQRSILGLFNRSEMQSYPAEQAYYYLFCRAVATKLIGFDLDYAFGPMVMSPAAVRHFLEYNGEYGDKWDAILVPRLRIINQRAGFSLLPVSFRNDPRMTSVESGNPTIILKRLQQFNNIVPSLIREWGNLTTVGKLHVSNLAQIEYATMNKEKL